MKKTLELKTSKLFNNITPQVEQWAKEWNKSGIIKSSRCKIFYGFYGA